MDLPLKRYEHTSYDNWPGKIVAILYVAGCDFRCPFCNTPELIEKYQELPDLKFSEVLEHLKKRKNWIDAVVITGGEPNIHKADVIDMLNELKAAGFDTKVETNGFDPNFIEELNRLKLVDLWSMDIKAAMDQYKKITGIDVNPTTIRQSIKLLRDSDVDYEFKTTVVPGLHDKFQIFKLTQEIKDAKKYIIQNFNPTKTLDPTCMKIKPFTDRQMQDMLQEAKQFIPNTELR
jgi:pyruvate formate lyase activating enzyme